MSENDQLRGAYHQAGYAVIGRVLGVAWGPAALLATKDSIAPSRTPGTQCNCGWIKGGCAATNMLQPLRAGYWR